tara:strand:- start:2770 stop:3294 length:525 start_codon:yes stop_codon:yes gene_type:complete
MAEFSGKIINAEYMDAEYSIIKVQYDKDGKIFVYNLDADPNHPDFQALEAEGWDTEKLVEATAESKRMQAAAWNEEINNAARKLFGLKELQDEKDRLTSEVTGQKKTLVGLDKAVNNVMYDFIFEKNEDKEELFKFKLWALEQVCVKSAGKEVKSSIRKAKRITSAMNIVDGLM